MTRVWADRRIGRAWLAGVVLGAMALTACSSGVAVRGPAKPGTITITEDGIPVVSAGAAGGGAVLVRVWPQGIESKIKTVVAAYQLELVANLPGDGTDNSQGVPAFNREAGKGRNDYSAASPVIAYDMPATSETLMVRFIEVTPGSYRARVKALDKSGANVSWPLGPMGPVGKDQFNISMNSVTVVSPTVTFYRNLNPDGGSDVRLDCPIQALTTDRE